MQEFKYSCITISAVFCLIGNAIAEETYWDYLRRSGRGTTFSSRTEIFKKIYPGEIYKGTLEQNTRAFRTLRAGDQLTAVDDPNPGYVFKNPSRYSLENSPSYQLHLQHRAQFEPPRFKPGNSRISCTPPARIKTWNPMIAGIDRRAETYAPCCGINNDCSRLPKNCFTSQMTINQFCMRHDRALMQCQEPWDNLYSPCVLSAHKNLSHRTSSLGYHGFSAIFKMLSYQPTYPSPPGHPWNR